MEILEEIKKELLAFEEKKKALVEELRKQFPKIFSPLFEKSELIDSVGWSQYTPYFNDGETCEFGVHNSDPIINGQSLYHSKWYSWKWNHDEYKDELDSNINFKECAIVDEFKEILSLVPDEFYKDLFGDHVEVTIFRDGKIEVNEYDHD